MTSSANDEWDYEDLRRGLATLETEKNVFAHRYKDEADILVRAMQHTIDFIEYNMRELEITGGNGD